MESPRIIHLRYINFLLSFNQFDDGGIEALLVGTAVRYNKITRVSGVAMVFGKHCPVKFNEPNCIPDIQLCRHSCLMSLG
ncbi:hypothetical protein CEXT_778411 [Caerostris extrusa]|uniref:Uncharacterized protein n=1 Tax=Caerostris extrusa TaxID=172846 RepID=A0AAV4VTB5_CAEEX|nr:hypothetical protein CEXT_778411 [Caerostris extrusa]